MQEVTPARPRHRVAVIDDHPIMCAAVASTFADHPEFIVVGQGSSASEAVDIATRLMPDLMLIDLNMPGTGIAAIRQLSAVVPDVKLLVLTAYDDYASVTEALNAGASGYALKGVSGPQLIDLVMSVLEGNGYLPSDLAIRLLRNAGAGGMSLPASSGSMQPLHCGRDMPVLSRREEEILEHLAEGSSNAEIATSLGLAESTVKNHVTHILEKMGVRNRVEAALQAHQVQPRRC